MGYSCRGSRSRQWQHGHLPLEHQRLNDDRANGARRCCALQPRTSRESNAFGGTERDPERIAIAGREPTAVSQSEPGTDGERVAKPERISVVAVFRHTLPNANVTTGSNAWMSSIAARSTGV